MNKKISIFPLTLLIVTAIANIRTLPTTAFFGSSLLFFYLFSSLIFLIPVAFISAEFSSRYPEEGGIFHWIRHAFGERMGLLAVWLQWINTMVWYPTLLVFIAGTTSYLFHSSLVDNKVFLLLTSLSIFWSLTLLNLRGIKVSLLINSICGIFGTLLPFSFLIILGTCWFFSSESLATTFSWNDALPSFDLLDNSSAIVTIMASFLGMELAGVYVNDIENPHKNFQKAVGYSVLILLASLILGSCAMAIVLPKQDIHFVDGVMQTFTTFLQSFNMPYLIPLFAFLIVIGSTGGSINWLLSPAKGLLQVAEFGFLPSFFAVKNKQDVPYRILLLQAVIVSAFCFLLFLAPSLNTYYWFLMALSTGLYMLMYLLLFSAALKLKRPKEGYKIPKGLRTFSCIAGVVASIITIVIGFQPPSNMAIGNSLTYISMIIGGFILMLFPITFFLIYQKKHKQINYP